MTVTADRDVRITVLGGIDADVRTNGFDHFTAVEISAVDARAVTCQVSTDLGDIIAMRTALLAEGPFDAPLVESHAARCSATLALRAGEPITVEKRIAVTASRDLVPTTPEDQLALAEALSYEALLAEHAAVWAQWWNTCDVEIDGDTASQLAMRVSLYHLLRAHVPSDPRVAIDAKGYAGEAYMGRYFWDTEMYLVPFFLYTDPAKARTLVDFRLNTLPGAQRNAASYGYPGARFPWESDAAGNECTPLWQYRDHEIHVTADVAYAMAHYAAATDPGYVAQAATALVEMARYWQARIDWRSGEDAPCLLGVMGRDEYTPLSSNNAYTNRMVAFAMDLAARAGAQGGATPEECAAFRHIADTLPVLRTPDGLVLQCEEFSQYPEPQFDRLWADRAKPFAAQVSQERIYRSKCLKQADVLMLMLLFPQEFTDDEVRQAWEAYVPYTTHDSSLSAGAHAIIATRLGLMDAAWAFWQQSSRLDLDTAHGGAAEGIHIAACGVNWQIAVQGFAGMRTALQAETLTLHPCLPQQWTRLAFPLVWHGRQVSVELTHENCTVTNASEIPLPVNVSDESRIIAPGGRHTFTTVITRGQVHSWNAHGNQTGTKRASTSLIGGDMTASCWACGARRRRVRRL